jgi:hypothetical protein
LWRLRAGAVLDRLLRVGPLHLLLTPLRSGGCPLPFLLLILLPNCGVTRLVTVVLAVKLLLLLRLGISIP